MASVVAVWRALALLQSVPLFSVNTTPPSGVSPLSKVVLAVLLLSTYTLPEMKPWVLMSSVALASAGESPPLVFSAPAGRVLTYWPPVAPVTLTGYPIFVIETGS